MKDNRPKVKGQKQHKPWGVGCEPLKSARYMKLYKAFKKLGDKATVTTLMPFADGLTRSTVSTYLYMFRYGKTPAVAAK